MILAELDIEVVANETTGNWKRFSCFAWFRRHDLNDADNWAVIYTHHRDSGLLDQSNAATIAKALERFASDDAPDVVFESHDHFAVGHIDGFSVRVFKDGEITEAFRTYHALKQRMEDYLLLDETDYSNREYEATLENIGLATLGLDHEHFLSDNWKADVYDWLSDHEPSEIENRDDQGGWPSEAALLRALDAMKEVGGVEYGQ